MLIWGRLMAHSLPQEGTVASVQALRKLCGRVHRRIYFRILTRFRVRSPQGPKGPCMRTCSRSCPSFFAATMRVPRSAAGRRHLPRLGRLELSLHVFPTLCLPICAWLSICSLLTGSLLVGPPFAVLLSPVDPVWAFGSR